jgi:hypothetical protein
MLDMLKRHEIQVLRKAGHNATEVAALTGVSRRSVRRVEAEVVVSHIDTMAEIARHGVGRPSKAEPFRPLVQELLVAEPTLLSSELLRRAKLVQGGGDSPAPLAEPSGGGNGDADMDRLVQPSAPPGADR